MSLELRTHAGLLRFGGRGENMRNSIILSAALVVGLLGATWTSQASAAAAAAGRDAAVTKCMAKAHSKYPKGYDYSHSRVMVYKTCMHDAGYPP